MAEPIRVAQMMTDMNYGGVEMVVMNYYRHIDCNKVQFDFFALEGSSVPQREEIERLGGRVYIVPKYTHLSEYEKEITRIFKQNHYKIVHSHMNTLSVFSLWGAKKAGVPNRIAHNHSTAGKGETKKNIMKYMLRPFAKVYPTELCACSRYAGEWIYGKNADFRVFNNAIDLNRYAHSSKAGAIARVADIGLKNHCVYNPHGWAFNMRCSDKKRMMYTAIEKMAAPFCEKIICISDAEKQSALEKKICRDDKLQVIFNGVDIEAYESGEHGKVKREDLNIPEDAFVVGMVGRISPQKAPDVFVKMAKVVKDEIPNAHFIVVGSGNQEAEIRKYAEENRFSENLYITGWVDDPMSYVELFDIACLLSRWEGFGLALPEYMMAGKPIVASRVDAIPNIIRDGENGVLIEADDATGASEAVLRIYRDRNLKDKLVLQGLEDVHDRFNVRRVSEEHGKLFEQIVK